MGAGANPKTKTPVGTIPLVPDPDPAPPILLSGQPAGNMATQRLLSSAPASAPELTSFMPDLDAVSAENTGSLAALGKGAVESANVTAESNVLGFRESAQSITFHLSVTTQGDRGAVDSDTVVSLHYDPGDPTTIVAGRPITKNDPVFSDVGPAEAIRVPAYPVEVLYERKLNLKDTQGRNCTVMVTAIVDMSHDLFLSQMKGRKPSYDTLLQLQGEKASILVKIEGYGPVQEYKGGYWEQATETSVSAMTFAASEGFRVYNPVGQDVDAGPAMFVEPRVSVGLQFTKLEELLVNADEQEEKRRGPIQHISGGGATSVSDESEGWDMHIPAPIAGILTALGKFLLGLGAAVAIAAAIVFFVPEMTFAAAMGIVTLGFLAISFGVSLYNRIKEAKATGETNIFKVLGVSILDAIGISGIIEAFTNESLLSGRDLKRNTEQRWEGGTSGVLQTLGALLGLRGMFKGKAPVDDPFSLPGDNTPAAPDAPAPAPNTGGVDASQYSTPEDYLDALRNAPREPSLAGEAWDHARFPRGPRRRWVAGDPTDMPDAKGTYPTFDTARGRFWRNRAFQELGSRDRGTGSRMPTSSDPISAMTDAELANLRDTATGDVGSPRDPVTGKPMEIEHFGIPQRAVGWLERAGFSPSEARRIAKVAHPDNLLDVTGPEHAFFDAAAHAFGRQRADPWGNMWADTRMSDPRVSRPLFYMSEADIRDIVARRNDPGINLSAVPELLAALRAEIAARGLNLSL